MANSSLSVCCMPSPMSREGGVFADSDKEELWGGQELQRASMNGHSTLHRLQHSVLSWDDRLTWVRRLQIHVGTLVEV